MSSSPEYLEEHKGDIRLYNAAYHLKYRERILLQQKKYREGKGKEASIARTARWNEDHPHRSAFHKQKHMAKRRGIEFLITVEEWIMWWGDDFELRGRGADDLCMGRFADEGPYKLGNIYKCSQSENKDRPRSRPEPDF